MTPAVSGPVATVTLILPAAVILNAVATHVGTITASALSDAFAVAVRIEAAPEPAAVPTDTVALPAAATAVVEFTPPPITTALSGMVSLTVGVQVAPPSTLKSYFAYATLRPCACPEKPGTPNRLTRTTATPVAAATSTDRKS